MAATLEKFAESDVIVSSFFFHFFQKLKLFLSDEVPISLKIVKICVGTFPWRSVNPNTLQIRAFTTFPFSEERIAFVTYQCDLLWENIMVISEVNMNLFRLVTHYYY
jgi:hypothetical protein